MIEKRRYPRFELKVGAKYSMVSSKDAFKLTRTRNISAEGICFESEERLNKGVRVKLEVDLNDNMPSVSLMGEVKWSQELKERGLKKKRYINGLELIDVHKSDEGRFLKYYCDRMVEKLSGYLKI